MKLKELGQYGEIVKDFRLERAGFLFLTADAKDRGWMIFLVPTLWSFVAMILIVGHKGLKEGAKGCEERYLTADVF